VASGEQAKVAGRMPTPQSTLLPCAAGLQPAAPACASSISPKHHRWSVFQQPARHEASLVASLGRICVIRRSRWERQRATPGG